MNDPGAALYGSSQPEAEVFTMDEHIEVASRGNGEAVRGVERPSAPFSPAFPSNKGSGLLKDQLRLQPMKKGENNRMEIVPLKGQLSFDKGFFVFIRALQLLSQHNNGAVMVGLAGPSGSGKTAFSAKVKNFMPGIAVLSMDMYNDASRLIDGNFDGETACHNILRQRVLRVSRNTRADPRLTDYDLLLDNLQSLRNGKEAQVPVYDFKQSKRVGFRTVSVPDNRIIIVEGIYALSSKLKHILDLRVSVTGGVHFDLIKRVLRDIDRSGQAPEEIIQQISDTVYPMYKAFIEPDLASAHIQIYNTFNPFSGFMDATYILKSPACPTAEEIECLVQEKLHSKTTESATHDIYLLPPGEDIETCQSWLRMRNRDGRYNLVFEEWVTDGPFIISPRISFEVSVKILGGLMALGYEIGTIMRRTSTVWKCENFSIKIDDIDGMPTSFVQIQGKARADVEEVGKQLNLQGTYVPQSYIEQVQMDKLTANFSHITESMKKEIVGSAGAGLETVMGSTPPSLSRLSQDLARSRKLERTSERTHTETPPDGSYSNSQPSAFSRIEERLEQLANALDTLSARQPISTIALESQIQLLARENHMLTDEVHGFSEAIRKTSDLQLGYHQAAWACVTAVAFGAVVGAGICNWRRP